MPSTGPFGVTVIYPTEEVVEAVVMTAGGPPGPAGAAATISIGPTTTGVAGTNATVANTGTAVSAVFEFTIPRGATGATGGGVATGGTVGQSLTKIDSTDFNTHWTSIPTADVVSARLVSVSAELMSQLASTSAVLHAADVVLTSAAASLSSRIDAIAGTSVTSAKVAIASAAATSADVHANTVSARVVSVSAELTSLVRIASAVATSADSHASIASLAATSADSHANTVSVRLTSASAELASLIASGDAFLSARITSAESIAGGGTVTHSAGALILNEVVLGAGGADVKVAAGIFTDGTNKLTVTNLLLRNAGNADVTLTRGPSGNFYTITMPEATTTLVGKDTTDILTNKQLDTPIIGLDGGAGTPGARFRNSANADITLVRGGSSGNFYTVTLPEATTTLVGTNTTDAISARVVSVSSELVSLMASGDAFLSARITSAEAVIPTTSVTSAKVAIASAAATSADVHANTVSARVVSVSAELVSLFTSVDNKLSASIQVASAAATSADAHAAAASTAATAADTHANTVSARVVSVSAELASLLASASAALETHINAVSAAGGPGGTASMTSLEILSLVQGYSTIPTAAGTTSISVNTPPEVFFTGSTTQTLQLPVVSGLVTGKQFAVYNDSSGVVTVQSSGANTIVAMAAGSAAVFTCISTTGTGTASWSYRYSNTATDVVSAQLASVSAILETHAATASAAATSADAHANTVSARVVSVSAELVSLFTSVDNKLSASIQTASAAATSADAHANTVSARVVSVSAELASLVQIASAAATSADGHANTVSARVVSVSAELASLVQIASAAATSADAHANTVSARAVSISNELGSLLASASAALEVHANTVSARVVSVSAELASLLASASAALNTHINAVSAAGVTGGASVTSSELLFAVQGYSTIPTAAATISISVATPPELFFTGSTTETVKLPDVTTLVLGKQFMFKNDSSGVVTVQSSGANTIVAMAAGTAAVFTCIAITGTGTASWSYVYSNTATDIVSARVVSVSAELASLVQIASAAATSADTHANTVSVRAVSISAELASLLASTSAQLRADITSVAGLAGGAASVTSAEFFSNVQGYSTIATAAGTTSISVGSPPEIFFTGSTTQTFQLPVTSTLVLGRQFMVKNDSSGVVTVQSSGANTIVAMAAGSTAVFTCILTSGTGTASWSYSYSNTASDVVSARLVSASAELASLIVSATARRAINTAAQASITVSTGITVSGVSLIVSSGVTYGFEFQIPFTTTLLNGIMVKIVGPATNQFWAHHLIPGSVGNAAVLPAANGVSPFQAEVRAIGTVVSTTSITLTGTTLMTEAWGTINPSATGSIKFVIGLNTSGTTSLNVLQGANIKVWRLAG